MKATSGKVTLLKRIVGILNVGLNIQLDIVTSIC